MTFKSRVFGGISAALWCAASSAASFDCTKANSIPEYLICNTPHLSKADDQLKILFDIAKAQATDKRAFNESVRKQWNRREKTCRDVACLDQWYADQVLAYSAMINPNSTSAQPPQATAPTSGYRAGPPLGASKAAPPPQTLVEASSIPTLSAAELFRIYDENEVAADLKFKGRLVRVEGKVESINVSFSGEPYISLEVPGHFLSGVRLNFSKAAMPHLAKVNKGAVIQVTCEARGMVLRSPYLSCPD
ncbi:OB-fold protein [Achromobacter piechaudii]|uniref:OB-fold protein n=1 Tax=Achromobacter piechaudii TaxID=72556 RepID=UPI00146590AA|nr:hypothetical protein [Achromobacter piechaudii]CAB3952783.1 hypothetical protein LMG6103_03560 [Achromobacter piechaudii]